MNTKQIKEAYAAGNSNWEVLQMVIDSGIEYPDAVFKMTQALRMDHEAVAEMEANYDECC
jgi:hypothetical protein